MINLCKNLKAVLRFSVFGNSCLWRAKRVITKTYKLTTLRTSFAAVCTNRIAMKNCCQQQDKSCNNEKLIMKNCCQQQDKPYRNA